MLPRTHMPFHFILYIENPHTPHLATLLHAVVALFPCLHTLPQPLLTTYHAFLDIWCVLWWDLHTHTPTHTHTNHAANLTRQLLPFSAPGLLLPNAYTSTLPLYRWTDGDRKDVVDR